MVENRMVGFYIKSKITVTILLFLSYTHSSVVSCQEWNFILESLKNICMTFNYSALGLFLNKYKALVEHCSFQVIILKGDKLTPIIY